MKRYTLAFVTVLSILFSHANSPAETGETPLIGSGASFPYQIYSVWFMLFNRDNKTTPVQYTAKGSGGGIRDFQAHKVDFAASDAAMNDSEIAQVKEGVQLLPVTAGAVVIAYNLPGIAELKLPRTAYPDIFLGRITRWNDPTIRAANPGIELPDLEITVVTRADSSGTTFVFTQHLSTISRTFSSGPGFGKRIDWPAKNIVMSKINAGVASTIKTTPGAIGYIDYGFASMVKLPMALLENREGHFIAPGLKSGQAALAETALPENMVAWLPDPAGKDSYPITTYTWLAFYKHYEDPAKAEALRKMVYFFLDEGQKLSLKFGYIPLPETVIEQVRSAVPYIGTP